MQPHMRRIEQGSPRQQRTAEITMPVFKSLPERGSSRPVHAAQPALHAASRTIPKHKSP
jgi:hypothetical protein